MDKGVFNPKDIIFSLDIGTKIDNWYCWNCKRKEV